MADPLDPFAEIDRKTGAPVMAPGADPYADLPQTGMPREAGEDSQSVFERGAPPVRTLSSLITGDTAPKPDKYQQAAIAERDRLLKAGVPLPEGYTSRVMSGPLLGWGDEAAAAMETPFEMYRQGTINPAEAYRYAKARETLSRQAAQEKTGVLGDVAEVGGALAFLPGNFFGREVSAALGGAKPVATVAGQAIPLSQRVGPALARMTGYGLESGTLGAIQGAGNARTTGDMAHDALIGGALGSALGAPFGIFGDVARRTTAKVPTAEELHNLGAADYAARDAMPTRFDTGYVVNKLEGQKFANRGKYGRDAPTTNAYLDTLAREGRSDIAAANQANAGYPPNAVAFGFSGAPNRVQATVTPRDINSMRNEIVEASSGAKPTDVRAGVESSNAVHDILLNPDPASLANGTFFDAVVTGLHHQRGRGNFGAAYRSDAITNQVEKTLNDAATAGSGLNFENRLRQNINAADKHGDFGGFTPDEQAGLEKLVRGASRANQLRYFGNLLGGGGGLGQMAALGVGGAGGAIGNYLYGGDPWKGAAGGLALGLTGRALRSTSNRMAQTAAESMAERLRMRSPEYDARVAVAPDAPGPGLLTPGTDIKGRDRLYVSPAQAARTGLTLGTSGPTRDAIATSLLSAAGLTSPEDL